MIRLNVFLHPCRVPHTDAALCAHVSAQETCTEPLQPDAARTVLKLLLHVVHVDLTVHLHHRHRAAEPETDGRRPRSSELGAEQVGPPSEPKCAAQRDSKAKLTCGTRQVKREGANRGTPWDNRVNSSVRRVGLSEACFSQVQIVTTIRCQKERSDLATSVVSIVRAMLYEPLHSIR